MAPLALLVAIALGAQEVPTCWTFELASAPADRQAFPSLRLGPDGTVVLYHGSGTATWEVRADGWLVSGSGSQPWTLAIRTTGVPAATLQHAVGNPHAPEPAIELAARPIGCDSLTRDAIESARVDAPPRLLNADEIDAALRREPDGAAGVLRSTAVRFHVAADGTVLERAVEQTSGDPMLDEAALRIAAAARFESATLGGKPVEVWTALWFHLR